MPLIAFKPEGLFVEEGNFFIDPWRPVDKAVITHAHADHSRYGMKHYLAHEYSIPVMKHRLGADINVQSTKYNETIDINGVKVSFHPAGHISGSAQIRVEHKGEVWVVSCDYKVQPDEVSTPFEPVKCHTFITESTFGLPVFDWQPEQITFQQINQWWNKCKNEGKAALIFVYALGKAQRVLSGLDTSIGPIKVHKAVENTIITLQNIIDIPTCQLLDTSQPKSSFAGSLIMATPGSLGAAWTKKIGPHETALASGWMAMRGTRRRNNVDKGFVLSDHADWKGLNTAVKETEAQKVFVTHGYSEIFSKWLRHNDIDADVVKTEFGEEKQEAE